LPPKKTQIMDNVTTITNNTSASASASASASYMESDINEPPPSLTNIRDEKNNLNAMIDQFGASSLNKV